MGVALASRAQPPVHELAEQIEGILEVVSTRKDIEMDAREGDRTERGSRKKEGTCQGESSYRYRGDGKGIRLE